MSTDDLPREPVIINYPHPTPSSASGFYETQLPTNWAASNSSSQDGDGGTDASAACIIAFEVIFSVFVFGIVAGCYVFGIRRRRRQRQLQYEREQQYAQAQSACSESMLERALDRHEQRMLHHLHMLDPSSRQSSSMTTSTNNTTLLPPYWPPDPTLRLPEQAVARLSQALLMANMARRSLPLFHDCPSYPPRTDAPPKYSDIYQPSSRASSLQHQSTPSIRSLLPAYNSTHQSHDP